MQTESDLRMLFKLPGFCRSKPSAISAACVALLVASPVVLAESCQDKVNTSGAYRFSHGVPIGNGMTECYVIAKDGKGEPIKDSIAYEDAPAAKQTVPACPSGTYINPIKERIIESTLARGTARGMYEQQLFRGVEVGLPGWERAHSQGPGTGTESPEAIYYAPKEVNQKWQNCYIEDFLRDLVAIAPEDERLCLLTATTAHPNSLRLAIIQYKVTALKAGESPRSILEASIEVQDKKKNPTVTPEVTLLSLPDNMTQGQSGTKPARVELGFCKEKKK